MSRWNLRTPGLRVKQGVRLLILVLVGIAVNLVSSSIENGQSFGALFTRLGWSSLIIPVAVALLVYDFWTDLQAQKQRASEEQSIRSLFRRRVEQSSEAILQRVFQMCVDLALLPKRDGHINLHYFRAEEVSDGRTVLRKVRTIGYDKEGLPHNYTLDFADPLQDALVICTAYNYDRIVYEVLPPDVQDRYGPVLRDKVDPRIDWVLACPVHQDSDRPAGVICAFGAAQAFNSVTAERIFEGSMWKLAEVIKELRMLSAG